MSNFMEFFPASDPQWIQWLLHFKVISHTAHTGFNFWDIWDTVLNMVDWIQFQVFILSNSKKIPQLRNIVNVSIALARPLLVKGEPGTGKTLLSHAIQFYWRVIKIECFIITFKCILIVYINIKLFY